MSESPTKAKAKAKAKSPAKPPQHPKYKEMICAAIESLKERNGSSRQAISKYLKENYKVGDSCDVHIKQELKRLLTNDVLVHTKGTGASGSFKLNKKAQETAKPKKKTPAKKKPAAKKPVKKPAAKKPVKKPAAKKQVKKTAKKAPARKAPVSAKSAPKKKKAPAKKGKK